MRRFNLAILVLGSLATVVFVVAGWELVLFMTTAPQYVWLEAGVDRKIRIDSPSDVKWLDRFCRRLENSADTRTDSANQNAPPRNSPWAWEFKLLRHRTSIASAPTDGFLFVSNEGGLYAMKLYRPDGFRAVSEEDRVVLQRVLSAGKELAAYEEKWPDAHISLFSGCSSRARRTQRGQRP